MVKKTDTSPCKREVAGSSPVRHPYGGGSSVGRALKTLFSLFPLQFNSLASGEEYGYFGLENSVFNLVPSSFPKMVLVKVSVTSFTNENGNYPRPPFPYHFHLTGETHG